METQTASQRMSDGKAFLLGTNVRSTWKPGARLQGNSKDRIASDHSLFGVASRNHHQTNNVMDFIYWT
jgi:hypothetical protein